MTFTDFTLYAISFFAAGFMLGNAVTTAYILRRLGKGDK